MGRLACLPVQSSLAHQTPRPKSLTSSLRFSSARFLSAVCVTGGGCLQKPSVAQIDVGLAAIALDEVCRPPKLLKLTWVVVVLH